MTQQPWMPEQFTSDERERLAPYFTNVDGPVFALVNLPDTVKGALFARYSRSAKSLRRLFLDEFYDRLDGESHASSAVGLERAERLYARVFNEYGDDSVAQLGGAHLACEGGSNILTKVLEWGRLMSYLEQSTRYIPYLERPGGRWKYVVPDELDEVLRTRYVAALDLAFETYARWLEPMQAYYRARHPQSPADPDSVYRAAIRAKALDTLRGLLPAATRSNVGMFGSGQAYESLLLRMRAHPLDEVQAYAGLMLDELRKVIPAFLSRVDVADRGGRWSEYLRATRTDVSVVADRVLADVEVEARPEVMLTDHDPEGELKVVAAALYAASHHPDDQLLSVARRLTVAQRLEVLRAYVGARGNRRHRPGRALERSVYRFDILTDYGAFRDLQRHRLLTLEWQPLTPRHGFTVPDAVQDVDADADWHAVMERGADAHDALVSAGHTHAAPYAIPMAYRVRFYVELNAREAMHVIELRTSAQGHPTYRRICQTMRRLIADQAGHRAIADAMRFTDDTSIELERLAAERALEQRRRGR